MSGVIEKARWIKPEYRRAPGQRAAHAIFVFKEVTTANQCIREGMYICGLCIQPNRLKHEPFQCMKCRKWGHFANTCTTDKDTCGTCGEEHRMQECMQKDNLHCVSCKSNLHASWDRDCPEFMWRCQQHDENYPKSHLTYFPTQEDWTLTPQPHRLQFQEKFPSRFDVATLPPPCQSNRAPAPRANNRHRRQQAIKLPPNQGTIDKFITMGGSQLQVREDYDYAGGARGGEEVDTTAPYFECELGQEPQPNAWD